MNTTTPAVPPRRFWLALGAVMLLALVLRLAPLALKAPWMDEAATMIFSLGNSSRSVPLNQLVDLETFLRPLTGSAAADPAAVVQHLLREDNHPPLYYLLAHGWFRLSQPGGGLASISLSRLLPALLGVAAVPLSYGVGKLAIGSRRGGFLAALWMAISPLALAQSLEIRHYSLAILLTTASLLCFVKAWRRHRESRPLQLPWLVSWIVVNAAGVATHYFFVFALLMQITASALLMRSNRRIWLVLTASMASAAFWLPLLSTYAGSTQSSWLRVDPTNPAALLAIPLQALLGVLFNAIAPGTYAVHSWQWPFAITAGLATVVGLFVLVQLSRSALNHLGCSSQQSSTQLFTTLVACGLAVQVGTSLLMLSDYTKGFRYSFFLIPPTTALLASLCELSWLQRPKSQYVAVKILLCCGLICALGVDAGAVLPKWYASDLLVQQIAQESEHPIVLAYDNNPVGLKPTVIAHEPLSVAWWIAQHPQLKADLQRDGKSVRLIVAIDGPGMPGARRSQANAALQSIQTPLDLWVIGGNPATFASPRCQVLAQGSEGSHSFSHYRCEAQQAP